MAGVTRSVSWMRQKLYQMKCSAMAAPRFRRFFRTRWSGASAGGCASAW